MESLLAKYQAKQRKLKPAPKEKISNENVDFLLIAIGIICVIVAVKM